MRSLVSQPRKYLRTGPVVRSRNVHLVTRGIRERLQTLFDDVFHGASADPNYTLQG